MTKLTKNEKTILNLCCEHPDGLRCTENYYRAACALESRGLIEWRDASLMVITAAGKALTERAP